LLNFSNSFASKPLVLVATNDEIKVTVRIQTIHRVIQTETAANRKPERQRP